MRWAVVLVLFAALAGARRITNREAPPCQGLVAKTCKPCEGKLPGPSGPMCDDIKDTCGKLFCEPICTRLTWKVEVEVGDGGEDLPESFKEEVDSEVVKNAIAGHMVAHACIDKLKCCDKETMWDYVSNLSKGLPAKACTHDLGDAKKSAKMCAACKAAVKVKSEPLDCPDDTKLPSSKDDGTFLQLAARFGVPRHIAQQIGSVTPSYTRRTFGTTLLDVGFDDDWSRPRAHVRVDSSGKLRVRETWSDRQRFRAKWRSAQSFKSKQSADRSSSRVRAGAIPSSLLVLKAHIAQQSLQPRAEPSSDSELSDRTDPAASLEELALLSEEELLERYPGYHYLRPWGSYSSMLRVGRPISARAHPLGTSSWRPQRGRTRFARLDLNAIAENRLALGLGAAVGKPFDVGAPDNKGMWERCKQLEKIVHGMLGGFDGDFNAKVCGCLGCCPKVPCFYRTEITSDADLESTQSEWA